MIGNIQQGTGFGGLLRYLYVGEKDRRNVEGPQRVAWTDLHHLTPMKDPNELAAVMRVTAETYPRPPDQPVLHISLSWAPEDEPTPTQMRRVSSQVLDRLGLSDHQAVVLAHRDTDHAHVHIVANRVRQDGERLWDAWKSKKRLEGILRDLEREHGFRIVPGRLGRLAPVAERPAEAILTRDEYLEALRKGTSRSPEKQTRVRLDLRRRFRSSDSWAELEDQLMALGLHLKRRGRGLVVTDGERMIKASRIDRQSSKAKLEERFGQSYESWLSEKRHLRSIARKISHHQRRHSALDRHLRTATDPKRLERLNRIKRRVEQTIRVLKGDLSVAYRPIRNRIARRVTDKALEAAGTSTRGSQPARTAMATLNLVSRLLPPVASRVLRTTIRVADVMVRDRSR